MDTYEIKTLVGVENYEKGRILFENGFVGALTELGSRISIAEVVDDDKSFMVTVRSYPDGFGPRIDCDCHSSVCGHVAALLISMESETKTQDDTDVIADIEADIDSLYDDVISDSNYDENANFYEDWEIYKYNLENNNDSIEYDYTYDICKRIIEDVSNPKTALRLFDRLHRAFEHFEYNNEGFDDAVNSFDKNLKVLFTFADAELVAQILSGSGYSKSWGEKYIKYVPKSINDESEKHLGEQETLSKTALEIVFNRKEYDTYIEKSFDKEKAYIRVIEKMVNDDDGRAAAYAKKLLDSQIDDYYSISVADAISKAGLNDGAAKLYSKSFVNRPDAKTFEKLKKIADEKIIEETLDEAVSKHLRGDFYIASVCACLAECGRCDEVNGFIKKVDFVVQEYPFRHEREYRFAQYLCRLLLKNGYVETSAHIAHDVIEYRLDRKDNKNYDDGVSMLKFLDSEKIFETLKPKHSEYLANLKSKYKTMRKFWGLYNGTWRQRNSWDLDRDEW